MSSGAISLDSARRRVATRLSAASQLGEVQVLWYQNAQNVA